MINEEYKMKYLNPKASNASRGNRTQVNSVFVVTGTFLTTLLIATSVAQATDLQIYAKPKAGQKTIVLMLDTSGSMGAVKSSSGYSYADDYGLKTCGTATQTTLATLVTSFNSLTDNTAYRIKSGGTYSYDRNFCYVSKSSSVNYSDVTNNKRGCDPLLNSSGAIDGYACYDRLTRLKDGLFTLLNNTADPNLSTARIGLGHYSVDTDGDGNADSKAGKILVSAEKLEGVNSTQRNTLREKIAALKAYNGTPSAHAYAEAAAYLLGTSTVGLVDIKKDFYKRTQQDNYTCTASYPNYSSRYNVCYDKSYNRYIEPVFTGTTITYYRCDSHENPSFSNGSQSCKSNGWTSLGGNAPSDLAKDGSYVSGSDRIYYINDKQNYSSDDSGFAQSARSSKKTDELSYSSPLPKDPVSCDGNGIYFLSDGDANNSSTSRAQSLMRSALNDDNFTCPTSNGLTNINDDSSWHCMGELAKRLFSTMNPQKAEIRTAFVGFGKAFAGLTSKTVQQACQLSSRTQDNRKGDDACSPNQDTPYKLTKPGYGNGLYYEAVGSNEVQASVLEFLRTFDNMLEPLSTGAISVPVDALNPNGFQPYGYVRNFAPSPGSNALVWLGNLKKYNILQTGDNAGALGDKSNNLVFDDKGGFSKSTRDLWNGTDTADGGAIDQGGMYWNLPMPTAAVSATAATEKNRAVPARLASPNALRNLFTDVSSVVGGVLQQSSNGGSLLAIPEGNVNATSTYILDKFKTQAILKDFPVDLKIKLLNYLGYDLPLSTTTVVPDTLSVPPKPFITLGGSIHSFPVQLTYSGELDENGDLTEARKQSVLIGTMEGGLHVVDAKSGVEQMVFVPAELLKNPVASSALRGVDQAGDEPAYGVSGAWVADPSYRTERAAKKEDTSTVTARQMNVYGGLRMGGKSYYGLNLINPLSPKLLFRVGQDQTDYTRMGETWSKPVLANIRFNNKITRVMIVGGGYDRCYENPRFKLGATNKNTDYPDATCNNKAQANGNAVYIIKADTGERLWWASNTVTGTGTANSDMTHSIVSRISTLDRDADGLVDHLYFADLGGKVFRADLNNAIDTPVASFGKRVVTMADLTSTAELANGDQPRFYQPPTLTIHDSGKNTFIVAAIASGDRSTPLDVAPTIGREGILPASVLSGRPTNKVYGLIDNDFIKKNLISGSPTLASQITLASLIVNPQLIVGKIDAKFFDADGLAIKQGWYRSLSSDSSGADVAGRTSGGLKAFEEEPIAIKDNLFIPVYDPEGLGVEAADPCSTRIIGETDTQKYCLPFGVCTDASGAKDETQEKTSGFQFTSVTSGTETKLINSNVLGAGIRGIALGPIKPKGKVPENSCGSLTLMGNLKGSGEWQCTRILNPTRWYEKYVTAK